MKVRIVRPSSLSSEEVNAWDRIRKADMRYRSPYYTFEFAQLMELCRSDARVISASGGELSSPVFIPVQASMTGFARPLGAPFCDSSGPILENGAEAAVPIILERAGVAAYRYTGLMDPDGEYKRYGRDQVEAYFADLDVPFEDYLESRRAAYPKHFKKARRLSRQAAREAGELAFRFQEDDKETMKTLIAWKREQYQRTGLHDVLAAKWARRMLMLLLGAKSEGLEGVLSTLRIGGELAAAEFGLRSGDVLHGWIAGYNPKFSSYSPGILLQERLLEAACAAGVRRADLGVGASHYKKYYASSTMMLEEGVITASGAGGAVRGALSGAWMRLEGASHDGTSKLAASARRRLDNILAAETTLNGRLRGVIQAFAKPR